MGPGERCRRAWHAAARIDPLGEEAGRRGGSPEIGEQAQGGPPLAERREAPGAPGSRGRPWVVLGPFRGGDDAEGGVGGGEVEQGAPRRREKSRPGEGANGPRHGRVEPREKEKAMQFGAAGPRRDRVAEVVAAGFLLVVGGVLPLERRDPRGEAGGAGGGLDPARGVALGVAARDGVPGTVEPRRLGEVEAEQEVGDVSGLLAITRRGEGDRHRTRVAGPDVGPAVASSRHYRSVTRGQRPHDEQRALVEALCPGRRPAAERQRPLQPAPVTRCRLGDDRPRPPVVEVDAAAAVEVAPEGQLARRGGARAAERPAVGRALDFHARSAESRDGAQHVRPREVSLPDRVGSPERQRPPVARRD